jgi:hypothetical protein
MTEKLYDTALQYKKTKLWKQLVDTELFALKLSNGEIGYCSVMGELGEHVALGLYIGSGGLDSYRKLFHANEECNGIAQHEMMMSQNCLQCSFENKDELSPVEIEEAKKYAKTHGVTFRGKRAFPQFMRYEPARYPWRLKDDAEKQLLYEALSATLEVSERLRTTGKESLGFQEGIPYDHKVPFLERINDRYRWSTIELPAEQERKYPSPVVSDELLVAKLKKKKKPAMVWVCEVVMVPVPTSNEVAADGKIVTDPENAPLFPYTLLIVDSKSEKIISNEIVADYDRDAEKLLIALARSMVNDGVPSEIWVRDKRTEILLGQFAGQIGTKVKLHEDLPLLDEIEEDFMNQFCHDSCSDDQAEKEMELFLETFMQLDDKTLMSMPRDLQMQMLEWERQGDLPGPVSARVRRLFR